MNYDLNSISKIIHRKNESLWLTQKNVALSNWDEIIFFIAELVYATIDSYMAKNLIARI